MTITGCKKRERRNDRGGFFQLFAGFTDTWRSAIDYLLIFFFKSGKKKKKKFRNPKRISPIMMVLIFQIIGPKIIQKPIL